MLRKMLLAGIFGRVGAVTVRDGEILAVGGVDGVEVVFGA